jgi:hypothetical protein
MICRSSDADNKGLLLAASGLLLEPEDWSESVPRNRQYSPLVYTTWHRPEKVFLLAKGTGPADV